MAVYLYRARSMASGRLVRGQAEAESALELAEQLRQAGYVPLSVHAQSRLATWLKRLKQLEPLGPKELALLYRQLSTMLHAGLPLVMALEVIAGQERGRVQLAARAIHQGILRGSQLAEAIARSGVPFPEMHVNLIRAGELSGTLDQVLDRLATMQEKELAVRGKVRSATIYPLVVLLVALGVLTFMLLVVVPTFLSIFEELNAELPVLTRGILGVARVIQRWWYIVLAALVVLGVGANRLFRTPAGRRALDTWRLRLPVFGRLNSHLLLGSMGRTMAMLLGSGLPLIQILEAAGDAVGNSVYRRALEEVKQGVSRGETLADTMRWTGIIPPFVVEMVRIGEHAGALEPMMLKISEHYDRQAEEMVTNLTALLEPAMLVLIGGVVALVLVSLLLPILTLLNAVETGI